MQKLPIPIDQPIKKDPIDLVQAAVEVYSEPTMERLFLTPWEGRATSKSVSEWRQRIGPLFDQRNRKARPHFIFWNNQPLVDGILLVNGASAENLKSQPEYGVPAPGDQASLAKWIGVALAFDMDKNLAKLEPKPNHEATKGLIRLLNTFMQDAAVAAWQMRAMPAWANAYMLDIQVTEIDYIRPFRPWSEIQSALNLLIGAFAQYTQGAEKIPTQRWIIDMWPSIQGCLAIRLLAGSFPELVSNETVERVAWLEGKLPPISFLTDPWVKGVHEFQQRIQAQWERVLLERITHPEFSQEEPGTNPTLKTVRRRLV
jgi:hypothetical protein